MHSLSGGGAERVVSWLANRWTERGRRVTVITLQRAEAAEYDLNPRVERIALGQAGRSQSAWQAVWKNFARARRLRRAVRQSDARTVLSFTEKVNVLMLLACFGLAVRVVIAERTDPRAHHIGRSWGLMRRLLYRRCGGIVVQTDAVREWARRLVGPAPVYVVPNAVRSHPAGDDFECGDLPDTRRTVALGRLSPEKGFDLLIAAFGQVAMQHPEWTLEIHGEGDERRPLEEQIANLALAGRVALPGWTPQPDRVLAEAELFVLPSRYEGMPNALLEAMSCGLPCVSFDCDSGPREIIRDDVDGVLVPAGDVHALGQALSRMMGDRPLRERLGDRAREVRERFGEERVLALWDAVLDGTAEAEFKTVSGAPPPGG
ncbi:MAG: glycosyltransferase family 4 protein [Planctomycetes bacterium]|nr:glycosyltransferase family 4 protein [Planctomycetota bacterium]